MPPPLLWIVTAPLPSTSRREFKHIVGKKSLVPNYTRLGTRPHSAHLSICTARGPDGSGYRHDVTFMQMKAPF